MNTAKTLPTASFGLALLAKEVAAKPGENVVLSPLSISVALGMTANGARGNTFNGIASALRIGSELADNNHGYAALLAMLKRENLGVTLDVANAIFARLGVGFNEAFLLANQNFFNARVDQLDFDDPATIGVINSFVSDSTNKKIDTLLKDPIAAETVMFLVNCVYFKGEWTVKFDKSLTKDLPFHALGGAVNLPIMYRNDKMAHGQDHVNGAWESITLPFGESEAVRNVTILPAPGKTIEDVLGTLDEATLKWVAASSWKSEGQLWLPRMDLAYENSLNNSLKALGMTDAFDGSADFGGMRPVPPVLFIKDVKHKAVFTVDEEGAEGAAVTSVEMGLESLPPPPFAMRVDRPFLNFVVDSASNAVLFASAVHKPLK